MDWPSLLSQTRFRELDGGKPSNRAPEEPRNEFERDYGRCIFSTPVRRLQDKAQVFPLIQHDSVRTRLTHSVEVSSVARSLANKIGRWLVTSEGVSEASAADIETVAATCAMIHDLGNPPFGHAGEQAIRDWFVSTLRDNPRFDMASALKADFENWEGNAQTIRLVSKLQLLWDQYGLNLTCGTLSAANKYVASSEKIDPSKHEWKKVGYFHSESEVVRKVRSAVKTGDARNPIAYVVEAADDIVYCTVDLEDGLKKRIFTWERLESELHSRAGICEALDKSLSLAKKYDDPSLPLLMRDEALVQSFRTFAISIMVSSVIEEFRRRYKSIMSGQYHGELTNDCDAAPMLRACRAFLKDVVYRTDEILRLELLGRKVIGDLLTIFWDGASVCQRGADAKTFPGKAYLLMSDNYRYIFESKLDSLDETTPELYHRLQLVCDYVAGMTDTFASNLHKRLVNA